jgi:hypothetical protein
VVHHEEERPVARTLLQKIDRPVGDDVRHVAAGVGRLRGCRVEDGIEVRPLAREDLPPVEAGRIAPEVPLSDHPRVVASLLQQPRDGRARPVEAVEHRDAVYVRVLTGQDRSAAWRADRVGREDARQHRALTRQPIDIRRLVDTRPIRANGMCRVVVAHDKDDVGPVGARRLCRRAHWPEPEGNDDAHDSDGEGGGRATLPAAKRDDNGRSACGLHQNPCSDHVRSRRLFCCECWAGASHVGVVL